MCACVCVRFSYDAVLVVKSTAARCIFSRGLNEHTSAQLSPTLKESMTLPYNHAYIHTYMHVWCLLCFRPLVVLFHRGRCRGDFSCAHSRPWVPTAIGRIVTCGGMIRSKNLKRTAMRCAQQQQTSKQTNERTRKRKKAFLRTRWGLARPCRASACWPTCTSTRGSVVRTSSSFPRAPCPTGSTSSSVGAPPCVPYGSTAPRQVFFFFFPTGCVRTYETCFFVCVRPASVSTCASPMMRAVYTYDTYRCALLLWLNFCFCL